MDPLATVLAIYDAIHEADVLAANERWNDLHEWIRNGGFPPPDHTMRDLAEDLDELNIQTEEMINEFVR